MTAAKNNARLIAANQKNKMNDKPVGNGGSFRDPVNKVYEVLTDMNSGSRRILRGLDDGALANQMRLLKIDFFQKFVRDGVIVGTQILNASDASAKILIDSGWAGVIEHDIIPFVSYPYEWTFSMLKDAALIHLSVIECSLMNGWTLKDATPYNIQWIGSRPVFIDTPSFEPRIQGEPWVGYRQFCSMFLIPLMLRAHLGIDHLPILRSYLDGIPPTEAKKLFTGLRQLKRGVLSHILLPAKVEDSISKRERDRAPAQARKARRQTDAMVIGLVQSLTRLVRRLNVKIAHTDWSQYQNTHSYEELDFESKRTFVEKHAASKKRDIVWDIGCNTGTFSRICSKHCRQVISIDGDHDAVEQLYLNEKQKNSNILPLVMNLSNISPNQGWAGTERMAFDQRAKPNLVLCLALIHHIRLSANIPNILFLKWLRTLEADIIIEFVNRHDEMVIKLLTNKKEQYHDYNLEQFVADATQFFSIQDRAQLKDGKREIFFLSPN